MTQNTLQAQLDPIVRMYRRGRLWRGWAVVWTCAAVLTALILLANRLNGWWTPFALLVLLGATMLALATVWVRTRKVSPAYRWIARQIEKEDPTLNSALLAAVEQLHENPNGQLGYLQERVISEALAHNRKQPWLQKHRERLALSRSASFVAFLLFAGLLTGLVATAPSHGLSFSSVRSVNISPGDTTIERGSGLVVLARFSGPIPAEPALVIHSVTGESRRVPLVKNLNDPVFGATIPEVKGDLIYSVEYDRTRSRDFKVQVFDYPALHRADANLTFPEYTGLPQKKIEDTRRISAVEGTVLDYTFQLNKPVASARLIAKDKSTVPLTAAGPKTNLYTLRMTLEQSRRFEMEMVDDAGRTNKTLTDIVIDVVANRAPDLKLTFPRQDLRASPIEEITLQAEASDDFGLRAYGVAYTVGGKETKFVDVGKPAAGHEKRQFNHLIPLEDLSAEPDQLITYYVWADDLGPDGQVRRTSSDMYFAEVRPFDEIFREGQSQPNSRSQSQSQDGEQQSPSEKLAELQKEIINATWKVQRQEAGRKQSANFKKDAKVLEDSQKEALKQATELKEKTENPRLQPFIDTAVKEMDRAVKNIVQAVDQNAAQPLNPALSAEQAAYQALLRLQAKEYEVTRSQNSNSRSRNSRGGQRAQQQLNELELKQSENRYETQRQAAANAQKPEQKEQLQVLNRLKELAQRQQDLNQRLKELQTALLEAKTEEEKETVRRQLKRLREEEQEVLADVDELRQRMNKPENQSQMAESKQQLDESRSDVRRASDALENGAVSQALNAGTRAERNLQQLRDDFRKRNSSQFTEEMRQMRSEARQLAQNEEEAARKMDALSQSQRKTLTDSGERNALADQIAQQKGGVTNLLNNMRRVTEQAENAEPLLAKELYDTIRKTDQTKLNNSLDMTGELLRRGFVSQAGEVEPQARKTLDELKRGVERAAESVLGDETEALRLARSELEELARQVENELSLRDTNRAPASANASGQRGRSPSNQSTNQLAGASSNSNQPSTNQFASANGPQGQRGQGQGQRGQGQQGQGQGQGQQGDGQQGQGQGQEGQTAQAGGQPGGSGQGGQRGDPNAQSGPRQRRSLSGAPGEPQQGGQNPGNIGGIADRGGIAGGGSGGGGPLTGEQYGDWTDRLRNLEEMIDIAEARRELERVRERARGMRTDFKRHSKLPQWDLVAKDILGPLVEVRQRVQEELTRRESSDSLVPIDRDPVPKKYSELVKRYYEKLGSGE